MVDWTKDNREAKFKDCRNWESFGVFPVDAMAAFRVQHFSYCSLVWMQPRAYGFHRRLVSRQHHLVLRSPCPTSHALVLTALTPHLDQPFSFAFHRGEI